MEKNTIDLIVLSYLKFADLKLFLSNYLKHLLRSEKTISSYNNKKCELLEIFALVCLRLI